MPSIQALDGDYDYIIVGAGTAGCVLANRLTEDPGARVLLLEAGGSDRYHWVRIPVGYLYCMGNPRTDWMMKTAPEPGLNGRSLAYPRGKVLGGCSSINGMIYMRGQAADYDHWRQLGNVGWSWDDVLPYFLKSEDHYAGTSSMHAAGGGWKVSRQRLRWEILEAVQEGAREFGIEPRADFNDGNNEGSGFFEVNQRRGERWNTADGFLRPVMKRPNLRVVVRAETERLIVEGRRGARRGLPPPRRACGDGRSQGPRSCSRPDRSTRPRSWSSPASASPSGSPVSASTWSTQCPGVGENLQDHLQIRTVFKVRDASDPEHPRQQRRGESCASRLEYAVRQERSAVDGAEPVRHVHEVRPGACDAGPGVPRPAAVDRPARRSAASVSGDHHVGVQPASREPRELSRHQPRRGPIILQIRPNYLSTDHDRRVAVISVRQAREIMTAEGAEALRAGGVPSRRRGAVRGGADRGGRQHRDDDLSSGGDVQRWAPDPEVGGRRGPARARIGGVAGSRRLGHAAYRFGEYRVSGGDDCGEGRRHDSTRRCGVIRGALDYHCLSASR